MRRKDFTPDRLGKALKKLRTSNGLTRQQLAERTGRSSGKGSCERLLEHQILDFENGKTEPSSQSLASYVAACSPDGETVDFGRLQAVMDSALLADETLETGITGAGPDDLRWLVTPAGAGFAVARHAGTPPALFADPARACLVAAILPGIEAGSVYRLKRRDGGFDVTTAESRPIGWLSEYSPETLEALQMSEQVVRSPGELSWFLEAAHPPALKTALRFFERRRQARSVKEAV